LIIIEGFKIEYFYDLDKKIVNFDIRGYSDVWIGIAFGKGMRGVDIVAIRADQTLNTVLEDMYSVYEEAPQYDYTFPQCDKSKSLTQNVAMYEPNSGSMWVTFSKPFDGGPCNISFTEQMTIDISIAFGTDPIKFMKHKKVKTDRFIFSSKQLQDQEGFGVLFVYFFKGFFVLYMVLFL
ncbi:hypothetical protein IMG5_096840, partial [Ichthyophthirius multifiliis]